MELRVLEYFVVTATEKSMTNAAKRLHITQPTLSIQLRELEEEVGSTLLERTNRGIKLTHDGEYFFAKAKEILSLVSNTVTNLQSTDELAGKLMLGGAETQYNELLFSIFHSIQQDYPRVSVEYTSANADGILRDLDTGLIEFAIAMGNVDASKYNTLSLPYNDHWIAIVRKDNPLAHYKELKATDLVNEPLIVSSQSGTSIFIASWLGKPFEELNFTGYYNLVYSSILMVEAGVGIALTLEGLINTEGTELVSIPLTPKLTTSSHLLWKKNQPLSPVGEYFLDKLQEVIAKQK